MLKILVSEVTLSFLLISHWQSSFLSLPSCHPQPTDKHKTALNSSKGLERVNYSDRRQLGQL